MVSDSGQSSRLPLLRVLSPRLMLVSCAMAVIYDKEDDKLFFKLYFENLQSI